MSSSITPNAAVRYALCALLLLLSALAMHQLSLRLLSQVRVHNAEGFMREGYWGLARAALEKAVRVQPHDPDTLNSLGRVYWKLGTLTHSVRDAFELARQSLKSYRDAATLNPLDARAFYGMARAEVRLNELNGRLQSQNEDNPRDPGARFEEAISLWPNGVSYRYAHARYLHSKGRQDELLLSVRELARIYPPSYYYLTKESFWSSPVQEACMEGLTAALKENTSPRETRMALSSMMARDRQWPAAITWYRDALRHKSFDNNEGNYLHLGGLYLNDNRFDESGDAFFHALTMSRNRKKAMTQIYNLYTSRKQSERFEKFYRDVDQALILPSGTELLLARTLMDLKQTNQARRILTELTRNSPNAEAFYWLARLFQNEKDWDGMELAIQKATVLDPENSVYHLLFSQALTRKKKLQRAEKEADLAIRYQKKPSPWSFNHRAWIRWARNDYAGALHDWLRAIGLQQDNAAFHAHAGDAHKKLGQIAAAKKEYEKALKLEPQNRHYQEKALLTPDP